MKIRLFVRASMIFSVLAFASTCAHAMKSLPFPLQFKTTISSPSIGKACAGRFWIYSVAQKSIYAVEPKRGRVLGVTPLSVLGVGETPNAIACRDGQLVIASASRIVRVTIQNDATLVLSSRLASPPGTGSNRDLYCREKRCWLVRDSAYVSDDLQKWSVIEVPTSAQAKPIRDPEGENPFAHWSDQFIVSSGKYFRVRPFGDGKLGFLDPIRTHVTVYTNPSLAEKWGTWGVWEGRLMYPKGFAVLSSRKVAISDVGTHIVGVFEENGIYLGALGDAKDLTRFEYPLDLDALESTLLVTDYKAGAVFAYSTQSMQPIDLPDDIARANLFRHPVALKGATENQCLFCHDGFLMQSLSSFIPGKSHHPIDVVVKAKTDLPLTEDRRMICATCHNPHHVARPGKFDRPAERMLRKDAPLLCSSCHGEKSEAATNHFHLSHAAWIKGGGKVKVDSCTQCHLPHGAEKHLLRESAPGLCLGCHSTNQKPKNHPMNEKVDCLSCHTPHGSTKKMSYAKLSGPDGHSTTCLTCHKDIGSQVSSSAHLSRLKPKTHHAWNSAETRCLECHAPHQSPRKVPTLCLSCHTGRAQSHDANITIDETARARGIRLEHLHLENSKVTCITCHDPHGPDKTRNRDTLLNFCSSCHGSKTPDLFDHFHQRPRKKGARP